MLRADLCLTRIAQVREAAEDIRSAYLFRTRLHRMLLSIQKGLAADLGLTVKVPCTMEVMPESPEGVRRITELCNSILLETRHLSQRSESLDARWQKSWLALSGQLTSLEEELQRLARPMR